MAAVFTTNDLKAQIDRLMEQARDRKASAHKRKAIWQRHFSMKKNLLYTGKRPVWHMITGAVLTIVLTLGPAQVVHADCAHENTSYGYDENEHWEICPECHLIGERIAHDLDVTTGTCICGYHSCVFSDTWSHNEDTHWHQCNGCEERRDTEEHTFGDDGVCTVCGYERTQAISNSVVTVDEAPHVDPMDQLADAIHEATGGEIIQIGSDTVSDAVIDALLDRPDVAAEVSFKLNGQDVSLLLQNPILEGRAPYYGSMNMVGIHNRGVLYAEYAQLPGVNREALREAIAQDAINAKNISGYEPVIKPMPTPEQAAQVVEYLEPKVWEPEELERRDWPVMDEAVMDEAVMDDAVMDDAGRDDVGWDHAGWTDAEWDEEAYGESLASLEKEPEADAPGVASLSAQNAAYQEVRKVQPSKPALDELSPLPICPPATPNGADYISLEEMFKRLEEQAYIIPKPAEPAPPAPLRATRYNRAKTEYENLKQLYGTSD